MVRLKDRLGRGESVLKRLFRIVGDLLVIGLAVSFAYIFLSIKISGFIFAIEPNQVVLWAEIAGSLLLLVIGINRFLDDI
jgi:uncharacterized membrane protein